MTLLTRRVRARRYALVRFELSKVSRVGMTIRRERDGATVLDERERRARAPTPTAGPCRRRRGTYDVTLTGTDLAGNSGHATGTIEVLGRRPPV